MLPKIDPSTIQAFSHQRMKGFTFLSTANLEFDARLKFGECMKKGNMEFSTSLGTKLHNWELAVVPMAC